MIVLLQQGNYISYFLSIILTLVFVLSIVIYQNINNRRQVTLATQIPGPKGYFIIGSTLTFIQGPKKLLENVLILCRKYNHTLFKVWILHKLIICVSKAEDIEEVMNSSNCFKKPLPYSVVGDTFSLDGLIMCNNTHVYKKNRKIVSGWLKYSNLKSMIPAFYEEAKVLVQVLFEKRERKSYECEICPALNNASMDTVGRTSLGEELNSQKKDIHFFRVNYERLAEICEYRFHRAWCYNSRLFSLSPLRHKQRKSIRTIDEFISGLIKKTRTELKEKYGANGVGQKHKPLIEILLENDHQISQKHIRDELITAISAGHETTAVTNTFTIFMLAHHQDVQENVFQEINSIFSAGDPNRPPTYDDLQNMEYLERVIKETMRLRPAIPFVFRETEQEMTIGKHLIPAGTIVTIPVYCLHLNPQHFKDPEKFNPDNFLPEVCRSRHPCAYIPFSAGPRNCVGMKYAMLQMKTSISMLVRSYRFSPSEKCPKPEDLKLSFGITMKFVDGCHVKIEPRT